jgi:molecular chaperone GrpE
MAKEPEKPEAKGFIVRDQRYWLQDEDEATPGKGPPDQHRPTYVEELEARLKEKDKLLQEYIHAHKSSVADMGDVRARLERDQERQVQLDLARRLSPFLDMADNLGRLHEACARGVPVQTVAQGVQVLLTGLLELLRKQGVELVQTEGKKFDPATMEALTTEGVPPAQEGQVLQELRPGFKLGEILIRPAGVRVGVAKKG